MITEKAKNKPTLAGTVSVPADINVQVYDNKKHTDARSNERSVDKNECINIVKDAADKIISQFQRSGVKHYIIANASTCDVCVCEFSPQSIEKPQTAIIKTVYKYDGKAPLSTNSKDECVIVVNDDNPCKEWENAQWVEANYGHLWTNGGCGLNMGSAIDFVDKNFDEHGIPLTYKAWEKIMDKENPLISKAYEKKFLSFADSEEILRAKQILDAWAEREESNSTKPDGWELRKLNNVDSDFLHRKDSLNRVGLKGKTTADQRKNIQIDKDWSDKRAAEKPTKHVMKSADDAINIQNARDKNWKKQTQDAAWKKHGDYQPYINVPNNDERETMSKFNKEKMFENMKEINEGVIRNIVTNVLKESLGSKIDTLYRGYEIQDGQPQSVEDVFKGDGWVIKATKQLKNGAMAYGVARATGAFGAFNGINPEDMVEELNIVLQKEGKHAEYKGPGKFHSYIEIFIVK